MNIISKIFGIRVKELREKNNWTQEELGRRINKPRSTITNYENGRIPRDKNVISILADILETTSDYLLGRTDNHEKVTHSKDEALDLKKVKKALLEKELIYDGHKLTKEEQESIRNILLAVIEREEKKTNK